MMKRISIILLTVLYLLPAIGFSVEVHVCGNKVMAVAIDSSDRDKCLCGSKMPSGCCKNIHSIFKLSDNQNAASELTISKTNFAKQIPVTQFPDQLVTYSLVSLLESPNYHAPPPVGKVPVYLNNRVFRV